MKTKYYDFTPFLFPISYIVHTKKKMNTRSKQQSEQLAAASTTSVSTTARGLSSSSLARWCVLWSKLDAVCLEE